MMTAHKLINHHFAQESYELLLKKKNLVFPGQGIILLQYLPKFHDIFLHRQTCLNKQYSLVVFDLCLEGT